MITRVKIPSKRITYSFDFADEVPNGVTLSSASVSAIREDTGESATSDVVAVTSPTPSGTTVPVTLYNGKSPVDYVVTILTTLSNANILSGHIRLRVREAKLL